MVHRGQMAAFLKAQAAQDFADVNTNFSGTCWTSIVTSVIFQNRDRLVLVLQSTCSNYCAYTTQLLQK